MEDAEGLDEELRGLKRFHGHLGPYVTVGLRMGRLARARLGDKLRAEVHCDAKPPMSCLLDGIQYSASCTLGKGNIEVRDEGRPEAVFAAGEKRLRVRLREEWWRRIDREMSKEHEVEQSLYYYRLEDGQLFEVDEA